MNSSWEEAGMSPSASCSWLPGGDTGGAQLRCCLPFPSGQVMAPAKRHRRAQGKLPRVPANSLWGDSVCVFKLAI